MELKKTEYLGRTIAVVRGDEAVIVDSQSALDLLMSAKYELGTKDIAIAK